MPITRLAVIVSATDPGGIGLWIDVSIPTAPHMKFRTDATLPWHTLV